MPERENSKLSRRVKTYTVPNAFIDLIESISIATNQNRDHISAPVTEIIDDVKPELFLVSGPWGSGTSAFTGVLKKLGLHIPGPYIMSNDKRTPNTYETESFRHTVLNLCNENNISRVQKSSTIYRKLNEFKSEILLDKHFNKNKPFCLKLPLSALVISELDKVFKLRLIICVRPFEEIERSRIRRKWESNYGKNGAKVIYRYIFNYITNTKIPFCILRYSELISDKENINCINKLTSFCNLKPTNQQLKSAMEFIHNK
tara:strand:- start:1110 stop:1886 length:777 start_codon:yes stop_codon:yes gene_type:complete